MNEHRTPRTKSTSPARVAARRACAWLAGVVLVAVGCDVDLPGKPDPADRPLPENQIIGFEKLFQQNCAGCHGADGELGPAPPLNDPLFLTIVPDDALEQIIRGGRRGTPMPPFARAGGGPLTDEQVKILAAGLKSRWLGEQTKQEPSDAADKPPGYLLPRAQSLQLVPASQERGAALFARACAECHGPHGAGGETDYGSGGAINDPAFLALISDQALRRIIITGRPDLGMPTYAESIGRPDDFKPLTSDEIDDLVALLASWRAAGNAAR